VNGIHHGDISLNNLMYDTSETNDPVGIVNDFDLATWVDHSATNGDRTGTIPFMAIDLLDGGLDDRIPRLYRHDMESFVWVLAHITVADKEYKDHTINITPLRWVNAWFKNDDQADRDAHINSKELFYSVYGRNRKVAGRYHHYINIVQQMTRYWSDFHQTLRVSNHGALPLLPNANLFRGERVLREPEDDDPAGSLKLFITTVETSLGEGIVGRRFGELKALLLEAIKIPTAAANAVQPHTLILHA
jgi:hypothetical protein